MKRILCTLLLCSSAWAQLAPRILGNSTSGYHWSGPQTVMRGRNNWFTFSPRWSVQITPDLQHQRWEGTNGFRATGKEDIVTVFSTGTLPSGMYDIYGSQQAYYKICDVGGSHFTLRQYLGPNDCSGPVQKFTNAGTGTVYLCLNRYYAPIYAMNATGAPAGSTYTWYYTDISIAVQKTTPWNVAGGQVQPMLNINIPAAAPLGNYTVTVTMAGGSTGTNSTTLSWPVTVIDVPHVTAANMPFPPPMPTSAIGPWRVRMTLPAGIQEGGASVWCDPATGITTPPVVVTGVTEDQVWYYDGAKWYSDITQYTGDARWKSNCSLSIASAYADAINTLRDSGSYPEGYKGVSPWPMLSDNMARAYKEFGDPKYLNALEFQSRVPGLGDPTEYFGHPDWNENELRPQAYQLIAWNNYLRNVGTTGNPATLAAISYMRTKTVEFLISELLALTDNIGRPSGTQLFYVGLVAWSLEQYYEDVQDDAIPFVLKRLADYLWTRGYDSNRHASLYTTAPEGPYCSCPNYTCPTSAFFLGDRNAICNNSYDVNQYTGTALDNIWVHVFAWVGRFYGDTTYFNQGDEIFTHTLDPAGALSTGKLASQVYTMSYHYVWLRDGTETIGCGVLCSDQK